MLRRASEMRSYRIQALDGEIGRVDDWLFDDVAWAIRYLVVDTGTLLPGRQVLVSPTAFGSPSPDGDRFPVRLSTADIEHGPSIAADLPVSRRHEEELSTAFGWPSYWMGPHMASVGAGGVPIPPPEALTSPRPRVPEGDPHLRSAREVTGYAIEATDGRVGVVEDFLVETDGWDVHYLVADTRPWWIGGRVIIAPAWCRRIDWRTRQAFIGLTRDELREALPFDPARMVRPGAGVP